MYTTSGINKISPLLLSLVFAISVLFTSCGPQKLSGDYKEDKIVEETQKYISAFLDKDYKTVINAFPADMQAGLTEEAFQQASQMAEEKGPFDSFGKYVISTKHIDELDEDWAFIVMTAKCKDGELQFSASFNPQMEMTNFFVK